MTTFFGRKDEIKQLDQFWRSDEAELMALYGRRRVGKTTLIRNYFSSKGTYIEFTGIQKKGMKRQLAAFIDKISEKFYDSAPLRTPANWKEAFDQLNDEIEKHAKNKKIVIFFDELPWMVTKRSGLLQELDHFWNTIWSKLPFVKIVLCGSAASWMLDKIINAKGGLHNRLTRTMLLEPFNLKTTEEYLKKINYKLSRKQITELYMIMGGIPFYLKNLDKTKSLAQNIESLCFTKNGVLHDEFTRIFKSLYANPEINMAIVRAIAKNRNGISREDLLKKLKIKSGGSFNKRIKELEVAGFIRSFIPYQRKKRDVFYRVIDEYCLFYLQWIEPEKNTGFVSTKGYWQTQYNSPSWLAWSGYVFESVCMKHFEEIRRALGLGTIGCKVATWRYLPRPGEKRDGAQIDLLFDRLDNAITLCEIKFTDKVYAITKSYAQNLIKKMDVFEANTKTKKQIFLAIIAPMGIKANVWSEDLVHNVVTIDDLFE